MGLRSHLSVVVAIVVVVYHELFTNETLLSTDSWVFLEWTECSSSHNSQYAGL